MGDNEEKIVYTPAEKQEIERILNYLSQETLGFLSADKIPSDVDMSIKKAIDIPGEDLSTTYDEETASIPERFEDFPEEMDIHEEALEAEQVEEEKEVEEEFQDITDLIQEIKEKPEEEVPEEISGEEGFEDISFAEETEEEALPSLEEKPFIEEELPETLDLEKEIEDKETREEPDFDISLLDEEFEMHEEELQPPEEEKMTQVETAEETKEDREPLLDEDMLKDFEIMDSAEILPEEAQPEKMAVEETADADLLDMEIAEISPADEPLQKTTDKKPAPPVESEFPSLDEFEDFQEIEEEKQAEVKSAKDISETDLAVDLEELTKLEEGPTDIPKDIQLGEPLEEEIPVSKAEIEETAEEEIDLSDKDLKKLNRAIQLFHPNMIKIIKDVIVNDMLPVPDIKNLVDMLLSGKQEEQIKSFLEKKLNKKIDISVKPGRRRVLAARPEYTKEGRERQKRLLKFTGIVGAAVLVLCIITVIAYQYAYIPFMAKRNINEGVSLIKKPGVSTTQKQNDYKSAEELFRHVNENYIKDYLYGYHSYAKAYFQNKEYDYALEKLNKAYDIDAANIDTLNNLGYFYAKVPETKFEQIKPELQKYYYKKIKPIGPINTPVDVAIDFYRKALNMDPKNITALYGIGNAYTYRGEYIKAKQYYEDILTVDKESIIGYSGLINLYIERDAFPEVVTIHFSLRDRKKLSQLPSALLAKLASYYLSKTRTEDRNIRIDHGIDSPAVKDTEDNPFPAVKNVLDTLAARDIEYPPLFVQFAKLSREQKNYNLMKRNLLTALEKEPNYFAAHVLLAEYYYFIKDFVEAYKSCKKALQAFLSPPEFTNEDFYHETEKIGSAYAIMGNIFYYSDKIKFRFGDELAEETSQGKSEEMANYSIAQEKYEKALAENYKSGEVFYNLGRIYYIKGQYDKATETWLNLYEDFTAQPELLLALGNAFYHQNNLEASKGEYLKVISIFENKTDNIIQILPSRAEHVKYYQSLSTAYNNLGAVYQIQNNETKSNISYWKAIDYAKRIERENEFARYNLARAFKPGRQNILPVLDENIADSIDMYKELK